MAPACTLSGEFWEWFLAQFPKTSCTLKVIYLHPKTAGSLEHLTSVLCIPRALDLPQAACKGTLPRPRTPRLIHDYSLFLSIVGSAWQKRVSWEARPGWIEGKKTRKNIEQGRMEGTPTHGGPSQIPSSKASFEKKKGGRPLIFTNWE